MVKQNQDRGLSEEDRGTRINELRELIDQYAKEKEMQHGKLCGLVENWVTETVLIKYLRARQWNVKKANAMLQNSLEWRKKNRPENISWPEVEEDCRCGKMYRTRHTDLDGRPCILMRPANEQHYGEHDRNIKFLIYILEGTVQSMSARGDGKMNIIIDFQGWTLRNSPPLRTTKETASILQNQYPERLCRAYLFNPPSIFSIFWAMVRPFLDPVTAAKVQCIYSNNPKSMELLEENFNLDELEVGVGGRCQESYDHLDYGQRMSEEDGKKPFLELLKSPLSDAECDSTRSSVDSNKSRCTCENTNNDSHSNCKSTKMQSDETRQAGNGHANHLSSKANGNGKLHSNGDSNNNLKRKDTKSGSFQWVLTDDSFSRCFLYFAVILGILLLSFQQYHGKFEIFL